jgi:hypothetical protein
MTGARLFALVVASLSLACFTSAQRKEDVLIKNARTFNDDLRWARWEAMTTVMPEGDALDFRNRVALLEEELEMADYEVHAITFAPDGTSAKVGARFQWYTKHDPVVRDTTLEQRWEYRAGTWQMTGMRRVKGDRFGLVPEPVTPPSPDGGAGVR